MSELETRDTEDELVTRDRPDSLEDAPENVPPSAWMSYLLFAAVIVGFGSCAALWMFN